jgi:hypothetical protein
MKRTRKLSRRSFLATVAGGVAAAGAIGVIAPGRAGAFQCSDSDSGAGSDPGGRGRRCGYGGGCSDSDSGSYADPHGRGRRCSGGGGYGVQSGQQPLQRGTVRVPVGSVQQYRNMGGQTQFLYNGRWYNLVSQDGSTLVGLDGAS